MENEVKVLWGSDVPRLSPEEIKALNEQRKREYGQMLEKLCPSKDVQKLAKRIAKQSNACTKCVYYCCPPLCLFPHTDGFIEDLEIDPCYEGVLRYLRQEMGVSDNDGEIQKLRADLAEAHDVVCAALEASIIIADMFDRFRNDNPKSQKHTAAIVGRIRDDMRELLTKTIARKERIEVNGDKETEAKEI
jgi:hypothetical protein